MISLQIIDIISTVGCDNMKYVKFVEDDESKNSLYGEYVQRSLSRTNNQVIKIFGKTEDGVSILVNILELKPFFYIGFEEYINKTTANLIVNKILSSIDYRFKDMLVDWDLVYSQPFEKFVGNDYFPYIKMYFRNKYGLKEFERMLAKMDNIEILISSSGGNSVIKKLNMFLAENNVDEIIKAIHQMDIKPASWISIERYKIKATKTANVDLEIETNYKCIKSIDKLTNTPVKIMIYDIECMSELGELGEFPLAIKNYTTLAKELIDLQKLHSNHYLIKDDELFILTINQCMQLAFAEYYYPFGIRQIKTIENFKPSIELIQNTTDLIMVNYQVHDHSTNECDICIELVANIFIENYPPIVDYQNYYNLSKHVWLNIHKLKKYNYNHNHFKYYVIKMIETAFMDYYDGFKISPIYTKNNKIPTTNEIEIIVSKIPDMLNKSEPYQEKIKNLANYLNDRLVQYRIRGDPVIQIGFTFQLLGEPNPYLKGIYTLNSCSLFSNDDLIYDENNSDYSFDDIVQFNKKWNTNFSNKNEIARYLSDSQKLKDKSKIIVKSFNNESSMIKGFADLIKLENPDMFGGYNNFSFDDGYLVDRASELGIREYLLTNISRLHKDVSIIKILNDFRSKPKDKDKTDNKNQESEDNQMKSKTIIIKGRITFDIYRIIYKQHNLPEYKLNSVCKHFLQKQKNDVLPTQIAIMQRGRSDERSIIARYCIIDCILCNRLLSKLAIIGNLISMSNVSYVPISYLIFRGQTIKGFSLVVKKCNQRNKVIRSYQTSNQLVDHDDKYEGAIVLDPIIDLHTDPTAVADFNSLYPSSIMSDKISNDTLVTDPKYDNLPGFQYNTIEYDEFYYEQAVHKITGATLKKKNKIKKDEKCVCRFVANAGGILCEIEEDLVRARKEARAQIPQYIGKNDEIAASLESRQLSFKLVGNSVYGLTGAVVSPIYNRRVAASITATGRKMIMFSKNYIEHNYINRLVEIKQAKIPFSSVLVRKATCIYGDSVTGNSPVLVKYDGNTEYIEIQDLFAKFENANNTSHCDCGKEMVKAFNCYVWSDVGWTKIKKVIRHLTSKKIYRIMTLDSIVDVTEDHSLLDANLSIIKPINSLNVQLLYHNYTGELVNSNCSKCLNNDELSWLVGIYASSGYLDYPSNTLLIRHVNCNLINRVSQLLNNHFGNLDLSVNLLDSIYILTVDGNLNSYFMKKWISITNNNKIPYWIFNSNNKTKISFIEGFIHGHLNPKYNYIKHSGYEVTYKVTLNNQLLATMFHYLFRSIGLSVYTNSNLIKQFQIIGTSNKTQHINSVVNKIYEYSDKTQYVYDIETENHHFGSGIGNIIVHNTDSVFIKFDMYDSNNNTKITGLDSVYASMEICRGATREISCQLKYPQNLEFEKTIYPLLMIDKKMYKGNYYEKINVPVFHEKTMGFATKKRDTAPIVKTIINGLTHLLFSSTDRIDKDTVKNFIVNEFRKILKGEYPIDQFIRTKSWKGHYENPDQIPQHVLALRQANRDPGNQFHINDRIAFIHIHNPNGLLQGDKIETVEYVKSNKLKIDYYYYIEKQIINNLFKFLSPNQNLGITLKYLLDILNKLSQESKHVITIDSFLKQVTKF